MPVTYNSADALKDISGAKYQALKDRFAALAAIIDAVGNERQALDVEIKRREKEAAAQIRLGALKKTDRDVYRAVLDSAEGRG